MVIERWPKLPKPFKQAILALAGASSSQPGGDRAECQATVSAPAGEGDRGSEEAQDGTMGASAWRFSS